MKCLECESTNFETREMRFSPEIKGEKTDVIVPSFVCAKCGSTLMDTSQMNVLRRAAADRYRHNRKLLTSTEIIDYRKKLGMSQATFSKYLKVGEASIKRWETYYVQDESQDELIRLRCDAHFAEVNALEVSWKTHKPGIFNGYKEFNWELFKQSVLYLIEVYKSPLFLNKALFYADFQHFKCFSKSITGTVYAPLDYGPCPDGYSKLFKLLLQNNLLINTHRHHFESSVKADLSLFDHNEKETLNLIYEIGEKQGEKKLYDLSHGEKAFLETPYYHPIRYDYAKDLEIDRLTLPK